MEDLEYTQSFDEDYITGVLPLDTGKNSSDDEGNESVADGGDKSNNDSSSPVHFDIPSYQFQKINVNHINNERRKIKTLCMVQKMSIRYLYHILKKTIHFIQGG